MKHLILVRNLSKIINLLKMWKIIVIAVLLLVNGSNVLCAENKNKLEQDNAAEGSNKKGLCFRLLCHQIHWHIFESSLKDHCALLLYLMST